MQDFPRGCFFLQKVSSREDRAEDRAEGITHSSDVYFP